MRAPASGFEFMSVSLYFLFLYVGLSLLKSTCRNSEPGTGPLAIISFPDSESSPTAGGDGGCPSPSPLSSLFPVQEQKKPRIQAPLVLPDIQPSMTDFSLLLPWRKHFVPEEPRWSGPSPENFSTQHLRWDRGRMRMTSQTFPLHSVAGQLQYCLFLLLIFTYNPSFSRDPQAVTGLIESVLVIHQPTWDDCQQLLQVLLTTEKKRMSQELTAGQPNHQTRKRMGLQYSSW